MNLRQLLYTHKLNNSKLAVVNQVIFFLTFLFGRLVFQAYFAYICLPWLVKEYYSHVVVDYSGIEKAGFYFCCLAQMLGLVLNINWMTLIVKGMARLVQGKKAKSQ